MQPIENVAEFLFDAKDKNREAVLTLERVYTYEDLATAASKVSSYLLRQGGKKGDRVLLVANNSLFWIAVYLGVLRTGLVCVPVSATSTREQLEYFVQQVEPRFAFLQSSIAVSNPLLVRAHRTMVDSRISAPADAITFEDIPEIDEFIPVAQTSRSDLASLMFTSGSTGKPRGVMVSHGNITSNTTSIIDCLQLTSRDRVMTVLPFYYCFGTSLLHTHLRVGGSLVLDPRFMFPEKVLDRMQETECTGFAGVPSHYHILLNKTGLRKREFPALRYIQQAGGHLPESAQRELQRALPGKKIFVMYGQTEATARLSYLPPHWLESKAGSIGKQIPGVKLSVLDENGDPVQAGEIGEIVAEGPNVALGYWRDPEGTAAKFRNGKLYTGDKATVDKEGFIYVVGRSADFVKCGGVRSSCKEIEDKLMQCGTLVEVAVLGVADDMLGEAVKAYVVPRSASEFDLGRFGQHCKEHLPLQLLPKEIVILDQLPKSESGKVLKGKLGSQIVEFSDSVK